MRLWQSAEGCDGESGSSRAVVATAGKEHLPHLWDVATSKLIFKAKNVLLPFFSFYFFLFAMIILEFPFVLNSDLPCGALCFVGAARFPGIARSGLDQRTGVHSFVPVAVFRHWHSKWAGFLYYFCASRHFFYVSNG